MFLHRTQERFHRSTEHVLSVLNCSNVAESAVLILTGYIPNVLPEDLRFVEPHGS